jgi:hypothetical protein
MADERPDERGTMAKLDISTLRRVLEIAKVSADHDEGVAFRDAVVTEAECSSTAEAEEVSNIALSMWVGMQF